MANGRKSAATRKSAKRASVARAEASLTEGEKAMMKLSDASASAETPRPCEGEAALDPLRDRETWREAMHLTHREKQHLKDLIDADEPLPARYRASLFAQPHEAELIWPGKTSEVTNVVLPFHVIEQIDEPRA